MENFLPDWNFENEFHISNHKGSIGPENELSELLWKDGQVILQSQTRRKPISNNNNQTQIHKQSQQCFKSDKINRDSRSNFLEDEETVSWIQYPLDDDDNPFEKDFSSGFFSGFPSFDSVELSDLTELSKTEQEQRIGSNNMAPPRLKQCQESKAVGLDNRRESSFLAVGLSHCGSKKSTNDADLRITTTNSSIGLYDGVLDPKSASCSGGTSGSGVSGDFKRKCTETEESETRSKSIQRSGSSRRRRVAEVHNLSERRRRDRINDKMKALQELIPHCSKTDKASVLDEAIDYLKSLQLQLQVMWMGSGMAPPMLFPGVQPCITRISMLDQSATRNPGLVCQNQVFNPVNPYQNPMPNPALPEQFARYIEGFHQVQATSQERFNLVAAYEHV